jgi:hypothetical protein
MTATVVRERPILFSGPMVRAILDGTKTQTRRAMKHQPLWSDAHNGWLWDRKGRGMTKPEGAKLDPPYGFTQPHWLPFCPYGAPGDRLWVREQHTIRPVESEPGEWESLARPVIGYKADGGSQRVEGNRSTGVGIFHGTVGVGRPSIHMKRWMSRLTLEITDVRVQRVQEISEADAIAEGVASFESAPGTPEARAAFAVLWDSLNAKRGYGWDANPWCWAISFRLLPTVPPLPPGGRA